MPNWKEILDETKECGSTHDLVRRKYLTRLHRHTGRNIIIYYSGWLQKPDFYSGVNDADKNGFMTVIHKMDRKKGLDLVLHTPGGETAATESIVDYLRSMFGINIRAIIPQLAMSAGTMIACACKEIIMGKHSSLGPIDPQFRGTAAHGIIEEFENAKAEVKKDPSTIPIWQPIIAKYSPTIIGECQKAIKWSKDMAEEWLLNGMLKMDPDKVKKTNIIMQELGDHATSLSHSRHLSLDKCINMGLKVIKLEDDPKLQDAVLSLHHCCIQTLSGTPTVKLIENHMNVAFIQTAQRVNL